MLKKIVPVLFSVLLPCFQNSALSEEIQTEPYTYSQNFETQEVSAWASYPLWQDTAYDDNFYAGTIIPGDPNISIVQIVSPYSNVDRYAGAQKKLDMYMTPSSSISVSFYIKTHLEVEFFKVLIAGGKRQANRLQYQ